MINKLKESMIRAIDSKTIPKVSNFPFSLTYLKVTIILLVDFQYEDDISYARQPRKHKIIEAARGGGGGGGGVPQNDIAVFLKANVVWKWEKRNFRGDIVSD